MLGTMEKLNDALRTAYNQEADTAWPGMNEAATHVSSISHDLLPYHCV